jgi:sulfopyruvate decarboxylase subunit beta
MQRIEVLKTLEGLITPEDLIVSSLGELLRDWWNLRSEGVDNIFSPAIMGGVSATALGLAIALPHRRVLALESDGSVLMNTGIMCTLGKERPPNMTVIVFDNEVYESIGGPPTLTSYNTDLGKMAEGAGCINCTTVREAASLNTEAKRLLEDGQFGYMVAKIEPRTTTWPRKQPRTVDGVEEKYRFLRYIERLEGITVHPGAPSQM